MTIDMPMFPPPMAGGSCEPSANLPKVDLPQICGISAATAEAADAKSPPAPAKRRPAKKRSRRPPLKRKPGLYYPTGVTIDDFFRAYGQLIRTGDEDIPFAGCFTPSFEGLPADLQTALVALARLRSEAAAEIERLVAFLDATELSDDLEPAGDELDSGPENDDEDGADDEPSLAALERHPSIYSAVDIESAPAFERVPASLSGHQLAWADGAADDCEDEHDGTEPDVDDEPSLGSLDRQLHQEHAWRGDHASGLVGLDAELDISEAGIGDMDGLAEQVGRARSPTQGVL